MSSEPVSAFPLATALKIAWREARSSTAKFAFVALAVAAGVGVLTGVRGFSEAFRGVLLKEARTLMAGDLLVRTFDDPTAEQTAALEELERRGVGVTRITETLSMMSSDTVEAPLLVSIKAVDPAVYPFYGEVRLDPPRPLAEVLNAGTVAASEDVLLRMEARPGGEVRLGSAMFRIAALVKLEPDRMTGSLNVGPRVMLTREGLERTELMRAGSRASRRYLLRLPAGGPDVAAVREELTRVFPATLITDYREVHPRIERGLRRATTFLSMVSLIAMIIGALGVAMAMHSHLQQRMDGIAIMKCLGARSSQIVRIYLAQTALLGLAGGVLGVGFGVLIQASFPRLIERYFQLRPEQVFDAPSAIQGFLIGILATLLFTLPPLLGIRDIRPALIFRREMEESQGTLRQRLRAAGPSMAAGAGVLLGVGLIAFWLAGGEWKSALTLSVTFLGALTVSIAALSAVAWLLLRALRSLVRRASPALPALLRHGIANLYRPGNHAAAVLVALGIGVTFIVTVYLLQQGLVTEMSRSAPKDMPNVFLINITEQEREGVLELLRRQPGLENRPEIFASVRARITGVNGVPIAQLRLGERVNRFQREQTVTWATEKPSDLTVIEGAWWPPAGDAEPKLCISEREAQALRLKPGARLELTAGGVQVNALVACLHRPERERFGPDLDFVFNPPALRGMPVLYFGGVRMNPRNVAALQNAAYRQYPTVTVINAAEVLAIVQEVVDQMALVVRFVALFAMLAGVIILASSVAGTRFRRIREAAILKTLGATRRRVIAIFSVEFLILGAVAGLIGGVIATGLSRVLLTRMLDAPFRLDPLANAAAVALTALIAMCAGWLASYRILGQKPMEVLRNE
ncbi:MAG: FtsX-like permease family protein [Bryobacteraceae bacterium]|nr:FtsX-like permease family protein [Bryobacteraceae bacterium]